MSRNPHVCTHNYAHRRFAIAWRVDRVCRAHSIRKGPRVPALSGPQKFVPIVPTKPAGMEHRGVLVDWRGVEFLK